MATVVGVQSGIEPRPSLVIANPGMVELVKLSERAAASDAKVLITGESGVGKDVIARHIHVNSPRRRAE